MKDKDYNNTGNIGWICPKCDKVNAPSVLSCGCSPVQQHIPEATWIPNPGTNPSGGWWGIFPPPQPLPWFKVGSITVRGTSGVTIGDPAGTVSTTSMTIKEGDYQTSYTAQ